MTVYNKASLVLAESPAYKAGKIQPYYPLTPDVSFDFTRATSATRVNASGNIEKETQNLLLQSNQFDTTPWSNSATLTDGESGYDGSSDAWLLTKTAAGDRARQVVSSSGVNTFSVYAKANTLNWIYVRLEIIGFRGVYFDLNPSTTGSRIGQVDSSIIAYDIEEIQNDWFRCSISVNDSITSVLLYGTDVSGGAFNSNLGSIYIQDAQLEQGLVARNYQETTTAAFYGGITDNIPRLDYTDSSCPSVLLEPQRTNQIIHSEYFESEYANDNLIINSNAAVSPEGVSNALSMVATTDNLIHRLREIVFMDGSSNYTYSVFIKSNGYDWFFFRENSSGSYVNTFYNLATGTTTDTGASIEDYGNGWYRCILSVTSNNTAVTLGLGVSSYGGTLFAGDGVSGLYIYGAQLELGSYATSYIPTYGTSVTRNAENKYLQNSSILSSGDGTIFWELDEFDTNTSADGFNQIIYVSKNSDSSLNDTIYLDEYIGTFRLYIRKNNILILRSETGYADLRGSKIAISWNSSGAKIFIDGVENASYVGDASNTFEFFGHDRPYNDAIKSSLKLKQEMYFPTALSDDECIALTTL